MVGVPHHRPFKHVICPRIPANARRYSASPRHSELA
jgi:hypothetical protein